MRTIVLLLTLALLAGPANAQSRFDGWGAAIIAADCRDSYGKPIQAFDNARRDLVKGFLDAGFSRADMVDYSLRPDAPHPVTAQAATQGIGEVFALEPVPARGAAPADRWRYADGGGVIGVIPTVTKPFCGDCDRVRLTADGQFRTCLFATSEFDLRALMRAGASDDDLAMEIQRAVGTKWAGHQINQVNFIRPTRSMSQPPPKPPSTPDKP